jgi:hypothetical protein|tara:strand:- start:130 stop:639 length:510 start_codon:yes stop_codon:yes gene_type:complete
MKKTGRTLSLTNAINPLQATSNINSISDAGYSLTTIFEDDREGYAWKVIRFDRFGTWNIAVDDGFALFTTRPDSFQPPAVSTEFREWATGNAIYDNGFIGTIVDDLTRVMSYKSLKENHMATNHLALFYDEGDLPLYNITLEEYQITDNEEIIYKLKESAQNVGKRVQS